MTEGWIQTRSGGRFYPTDPKPSDINITDIAHALGNICRFTGHCSEFYSVAQHSVHVSLLVPEKFAMWALLHDASEAYLLDLARPIKRMPQFVLYRHIEEQVMRAVAMKFDLSWPEPAEVKDADYIALATEARDLMPQREKDKWAWLPEPDPVRIRPQDPLTAKVSFLKRYEVLSEQRRTLQTAR